MSNLEAKIKITAENSAGAGLNSAAIQAESTFSRIGDAAKKAENETRDALTGISKLFNNVVSDVKRNISNLTGVLAGFASISFAKSILHTADAMAVLEGQVRNVTGSTQEAAAVQAELLAVSNRTYSSIEATTDLFVKTTRAMKDYGYSAREVIKFTEATANAMTIGGVGAQQQAAAIMQLSQALGSGVLQGDEFKSIAEAAPVLLDTIAEYVGKSRAEIKKLGSEGKLTADVVFNAISGASEKFAAEAAKMPMNLGKALQVLQNNWQVFIHGLMNSSGIMRGVANVVKWLADNLKEIAGTAVLAGVGLLIAKFVTLTVSVKALFALMMANPFVAAAAAIVALLHAMGELGNALDAISFIVQDVVGLITTDFQGLADLITAVFLDISRAVSEFVSGSGSLFGSFFDDTGDGFIGLLEKAGKVFDLINIFTRTSVVKSIETFADLWRAVEDGAISATNSAIKAVQNLVNNIISGINSVISLVNSIPTVNIGMVGKVDWTSNLPKPSGIGKQQRSFADIFKEESNRQDGNGLQAYFARFRQRQAQAQADLNKRGAATRSAAGGGGGGGRKGGGGKRGGAGGGSGKEKDPMSEWEAQIKAQKLAHDEMRQAQKTHDEWDKNRELAFWQAKLAIVGRESKNGVKIREKILALEQEIGKKATETALRESERREKLAQHWINVEEDLYEQAKQKGEINRLQRLDAEIAFEQKRYEIAYEALQQRIALMEQDPTYGQDAIDRLKQQAEDLTLTHERKQGQNAGKREQARREDAPSFTEMLQDGGKQLWDDAEQHMSNALTAMLTRTQNFREAMGNMFKSMGQSFIQEMVTKPLMGMMRRAAMESSIWKMLFGQKNAMESAASAKTIATKGTETAAVVGKNAVQAGSGAASALASIPYVGPALAIAAMAAMVASVMGLMGGGGGSETTTVTKIPSAAGGWDIPAGINPLTQLHESEMVLPAEQAQVIRDMAANGGGSQQTVVINTTGGDFIHKNDLAKLLKQMNRDFVLA